MIRRRFKDPGEASQEIFDGFNKWSAGVGRAGIQTTYAVIAANWAAHASASTILTNEFARLSMAIAIGSLAVNLILAAVVTKLLAKRCDEADTDKAAWEEAFKAADTTASPFPYTTGIERLGGLRRLLLVLAPLVSGSLFVISLFGGGHG